MNNLYYTTADDMAKLDAIAVENGLEIRQMMELASFYMVDIMRREQISYDKSIVVVAGTGNKGGDGIASARHLVNYGWLNVVIIISKDSLKKDPAHHLRLCHDMNIPIINASVEQDIARKHIKKADVIIDALIGYNLSGTPNGIAGSLIEAINEAFGFVISYDVPSGSNATTGVCTDVCVNADATLTLAFPKMVFKTESGKQASGTQYLGDIGIPQWMYQKAFGMNRPNFSSLGVVKLR